MWLPAAPRAAEYSQTVRSAQSRFAGSQGHFTLRNRFARANPGPVEPRRGRSWGTAPPTAASVLGTARPDGRGRPARKWGSKTAADRCGRDARVPRRGALRGRLPATRHLLHEAGRARSEEEPFPGGAALLRVPPVCFRGRGRLVEAASPGCPPLGPRPAPAGCGFTAASRSAPADRRACS